MESKSLVVLALILVPLWGVMFHHMMTDGRRGRRWAGLTNHHDRT